MLSVTELRAGTTFSDKGRVYEVLKYHHVKLGRGKANIKLKVRDLKSGAVLEKTYLSGSRVEPANLIDRAAQYLYKRGEDYFFMDQEDFNQYEIPLAKLGEKAKFLKEGMIVQIQFLEGEPLNVQLPVKAAYEVKEAPPGVKGDTSTNIFKIVTLETDMKVKVPLFINRGDKIVVDTRTGEYIERVKN